VPDCPAPNDSVGALAEALGHEGAKEIVGLFLSDFPDSMRKLAAGGLPEQIRIVHGIKSSALHMGAMKLSARMAALEDGLGKGSASITAETLAAIAAEFDAIAPALRAYAGA
jgi:HPt (histidine-containing phosphotransfer) domain-containing protein